MSITRDRAFWTIALQISAVNFFMGGFGPAQPLLRAEQHTSLAIAGLHGTALGVAAIFAGMAAPKLVHTFGRSLTAWLGLAIFCLGGLGFIFAPPVQITLLAILICGFGISVVINSMVTQLSQHFGEKAGQAVSQAAGIGSVGYVLGTLTVGSIANTSLSWRLGLVIIAPFSLVLYLLNRNKVGAELDIETARQQGGSLSSKFWFAWIGFVACISSEFATTFWSAALLRDRSGSSAAISTICVVAFGVGMGTGRWFGPRWLRKIELDRQIKAMMIVQLIGFSVLWSSHVLWISLLALFANGIGLAMQFGLISLRLIGFSGGRPDLAIGRSSLGAGIAIGGAPFLLGLVGDHLGISRAYLMVPLLVIISMGMIFLVPSESTSEKMSHEL
ncbi:MAG: MFS transporter [Actinobacteria bacterium]|nr:MFS transporter [Actinomycetota bacterium]